MARPCAKSNPKALSGSSPGAPFTRERWTSRRRRRWRTNWDKGKRRREKAERKGGILHPRPVSHPMGLAKRVIPCLDVTRGRVVKGVNFVGLRDAGDPVEIARRYDDQGADELTFLDITASSDERDMILHIVEAVAAQVFIPLTVGGGVRKVEDVRRLLNAGADKVSINTSAVLNPQLVADAAGRYGSQCIVVAIDAKQVSPGHWEVFTHGGRKATGLDAVAWAKKMQDLGAGEI